MSGLGLLFMSFDLDVMFLMCASTAAAAVAFSATS